eukprot:GILJ01010357.1.p1 GENE.GILJ01010357.1~~GILJ01010357.1.p1  ORF type:complete len:257 (+),score=41.20 GILJ01010357.1:578-1348(+)
MGTGCHCQGHRVSNAEISRTEILCVKKSALTVLVDVNDAMGTSALPDDLLAGELIHPILASFGGIHRVGSFLFHALHENPNVLKKVKEEAQNLPRNAPVSLQSLANLTYSHSVTREILRFYPVVPFLTARVKETFTYKDMLFPKDMLVYSDVYGSNQDGSIYTRPEQFEPERFMVGMEEDKKHEYAYTPQGGSDVRTDHRCAGEQLTQRVIQTIALLAVRDYSWECPAQDFSYGLELMCEPKDHVIISNIKSVAHQ